MNPSKQCIRKLCLLFFVVCTFWGCGSGSLVQSDGNKDDALKHNAGTMTQKVSIYVDEFVNNVNKYENELVTIKGIFMGWRGSCKTPPPETRSDWMMEYNEVCVYVSGPPPLGIDITPNSKDIGKVINIHGKVLIGKSGTPYIKISINNP